MQEKDRHGRDDRAEYIAHLKDACEQSIHEAVYHEPETPESVVYDPRTGLAYMRKVLDFGSPDVFEYLRTHASPYIPRVYHWQRLQDRPGKLVVLEEFIPGQNLADILSKRPLPPEEIRREWMLELCDALEFLHQAEPQIIHRDVKAENILITGDGALKLIDYDAAKVYHPEENRDTVLLGTDGSAAPEQYGFGQSDERTDIFGAGRLIERMFPDDPDMECIAKRACRLDPEDRYQNAGQLRQAILGQDEDARRGGAAEAAGPAARQEQGNAGGAAEPAGRERRGAVSARREPGLERRESEPERSRFGPIPGFRSGTPWKMVAAAIGYAGIVSFSITLDVSNVSKTDLWSYRIGVLVWMFMSVDILFGWSPPARSLPGLRTGNPALRFILKILWCLAAFVLVIVVIAILFPA